MVPERTVHYADSGGLQIAYEVIGDGPLDIVLGYDTGGNIDVIHEIPEGDRFLRRFGEFGRLIHVDLRGAGLSDPIEDLPTLEDWVDDVRAVLAEAQEVFPAASAPRDFDLVRIPFPERGAPVLVENGAREQAAPEPSVAP